MLNMEDIEKDTEEASEPCVLSENQEVKSSFRVPTQEAEQDPSVEVKEEEALESQSQEEKVEEGEKLVTPQRIISLQRDLPTLVTNIQTAADARESIRRTELEEARRLRLERLENDAKSSREKFEEITRQWSIAKQKVIPQELQEALNNQQQLCAALIEDKKKLINDLQQELKVGDDRYVKDLRKQAEELDLMMERMEDQIKTLTKAYREELAHIERVYQQESEVLLTRDKTEWEQYMKELWNKELERLMQRKKKVEEYEAIIHNLMLETTDKYSVIQLEQNAKWQVLEREHQQTKATSMIVKLKQIKQKDEVAVQKFSLAHMKSRIISLQTEMKNLMTTYTSEEKQFTKRSRYLSEDYKRNIQQYERIQKKIEHFAVADVRKFEEMWLMIEAEMKQLVERALVIDSLICKQHLGLAWERPSMAFMELSGPIQPQKQAWRPARQGVSQLFHTEQALQSNERMMDASVGPRLETDTESTDMEMYKEGTAVQSESGAEVEEEKLSMETMKKVMELLCDEAGFLMDDKLLKLLTPLEKEEQTVVKLGSLLNTFGIEEEDVPKLAHFLFKYKHQQREQTKCFVCLQDVCVESGESSGKAEEVETNSTGHLTSDIIDPIHVVPALKSFLEQLVRSSSTRQNPSFHHSEARDTSEDEAYWESMGNIISEDRLKLWDAAENTLKKYHAVLMEICELVPEIQSLEQQNTELRMLLQQSLNSRVSTEMEMQ
ncbi:dynein regulatory complex protein 1 isoform X2 [Micropterus dolomieu]|uniref:dynein regulatory complex protein 1 isoform X2 n=1 Tax=Micropterus dolomieu TaxID=147949 RepID=UPI001E8D9F1B|nr:dynein regulatory complex protein 1 isoform X2 [Micropterus dolomieu]